MYFNYVCGNTCETVHFMMRQKLLHGMKEVCGATSHMMKNELIVGEHQEDETRLLIYRCINFFAILVSQVRCYCNLYLLSFIVTMYWTKFLFELYSNSRFLIHNRANYNSKQLDCQTVRPAQCLNGQISLLARHFIISVSGRLFLSASFVRPGKNDRTLQIWLDICPVTGCYNLPCIILGSLFYFIFFVKNWLS